MKKYLILVTFSFLSTTSVLNAGITNPADYIDIHDKDHIVKIIEKREKVGEQYYKAERTVEKGYYRRKNEILFQALIYLTNNNTGESAKARQKALDLFNSFETKKLIEEHKARKPAKEKELLKPVNPPVPLTSQAQPIRSILKGGPLYEEQQKEHNKQHLHTGRPLFQVIKADEDATLTYKLYIEQQDINDTSPKFQVASKVADQKDLAPSTAQEAKTQTPSSVNIDTSGDEELAAMLQERATLEDQQYDNDEQYAIQLQDEDGWN